MQNLPDRTCTPYQALIIGISIIKHLLVFVLWGQRQNVQNSKQKWNPAFRLRVNPSSLKLRRDFATLKRQGKLFADLLAADIMGEERRCV